MRREQRSAHSMVSWKPWWFHFHNCSAGKGQELRVRNPCRRGSNEQFHLTRMRAPVLAHMLLPAEPEANVCTHKDVLPTGVGHTNSSGRWKGFGGPRALRTGKIRGLHSRRVVYGWFGSPCSPHQRSMVLVAPWTFFFAGYFCSNRLARSSELVRKVLANGGFEATKQTPVFSLETHPASDDGRVDA